ncbi:MAG: DEAD/DEAH box helicase [Magnetococcales bacterium]|nr:DEAD/DEAH box helicase [Magnetococcales bacterium]
MPAQALIGDPYPQRHVREGRSSIDRIAQWFRLTLETHLLARPGRIDWVLARIEREEELLQSVLPGDRSPLLAELRRQLRCHGLSGANVARCFALVRTLAGEILGMRHFPAQLRGGYHLLHGRVVEMDTGEGKTLMATLPAITVALSGMKVHVVTVNDYLAQRDANLMKPLYAAFGLSTGLVLEGTPSEEKIQAYRQDIVYCTNKTLVFDYLRDRITLGRHMKPLIMSLDRLTGRMRDTIMLHGLQFAIVDEADSVFIDEARTPLIISAERRDPGAEEFHAEAIALARQLIAGEDYEMEGRVPHVTDAGRERLEGMRRGLSGLWRGDMRSQETIRQALWALHGFQRDVHYIVREHQGVAKVMIVDEHTGRVMPDRSWERGLQQLIELKEGVPVSPEKEVMARISYQSFFRRYLRLSGMTGTCREVARELMDVYGVGVVRVQPQRRSRRQLLPSCLYATADERWQAVLRAIIERRDKGQAVLVGTRTVAASEALSARLDAAGIAHRVLNAKQDKTEAETIRKAGMGPRVTIATNMAGRGTDIQPDDSVLAAGGLHVILTEGHDNARVDRQMIGRCARQGDPGSAQFLLSLEDDLVKDFLPPLRYLLALMLAVWRDSPVLQAMARLFYRFAQWRVERLHRRIRRRQLDFDFQMRQALSFSGTLE